MKQFIQSIKIWYLVVVFVISLPLSAYLLRQNNLEMIKLRDKVVQIDEQTGDIEKVKPALGELRSYIFGHMNTDMAAPLELPGSYNTAVEQARKRAEQSGTANGGVYRRAQAVCEDPNVLLSVRAQCIQDFVTENSQPGTNPESLEFPPKELFSYDFAAPVWSLDLAGLSVLTTIVSGTIVVSVLVFRFVRGRIRHMIDDDPLE